MIRVIAAAGLLLGLGCATVRLPESVNVNTGSTRRVDSSQVPKTSTHGECRDELHRAYAEIRRLERKIDGYRRDIDELKDDKKALKKKIKRLEKKLDRYTD